MSALTLKSCDLPEVANEQTNNICSAFVNFGMFGISKEGGEP